LFASERESQELQQELLLVVLLPLAGLVQLQEPLQKPLQELLQEWLQVQLRVQQLVQPECFVRAVRKQPQQLAQRRVL
jgi:hypothetical protein